MMYRTKGFTSKQGIYGPPSHWLGACAAGGRTLRVCPSAVPLGRSAPRVRPAPGGGPAFFGRKPEERTPGRKRFFLPGPTFSGWGDPAGVLSFFLPGLRPICPTPVTARPPAGRAGRGGCCSRKGTHLPPKPSPRGEGAPVRTLGRMRGRLCTQPFLVEVEKGGCRLSPQRSVSSAPLGESVAPSSVTFGDSFPPRGSLRAWEALL